MSSRLDSHDSAAGPVSAEMDHLVEMLRAPEPVLVIRPSLPALDRYRELLEPIWKSGWLTNHGQAHRQLEAALTRHLEVDHLSLLNNGTTALLIALESLGIRGGEVITTPFTFPATVHALHWSRCEPVFADIDPTTLNLDPNRIEQAVTSRTTAILPVHVYGRACAVQAIEAVARRHGLPVIYDASHAFGVRFQGRSLLSWGDAATLSFHATKLFSTAEGGAIVARERSTRDRVEQLANFGILDEETVVRPGINGKLSELQAAFGLACLDDVAANAGQRRALVETYRELLAGVPGVGLPPTQDDVQPNDAYMPVLIDASEFGLDRDRLHTVLKRFNVFTRKYFSPLCSQFECYRGLASARSGNLKVAEQVERQVLCLPLSATYPRDTVVRVCTILRELHRLAIGTGRGGRGASAADDLGALLR